MIRYVWIMYPKPNGSASIRVYDRYTDRVTWHFVNFN